MAIYGPAMYYMHVRSRKGEVSNYCQTEGQTVLSLLFRPPAYECGWLHLSEKGKALLLHIRILTLKNVEDDSFERFLCRVLSREKDFVRNARQFILHLLFFVGLVAG